MYTSPQKSYTRFVLGTLLIFILVVGLGVSYSAYRDRAVVQQIHLQRAQGGVMMMEDQLTQTLQLVENTLRTLPELSGQPLGSAPSHELSVLLQRLQHAQPALRSLSVMTQREGIRASTNPENLGLRFDLEDFSPPDQSKAASSVLRFGAAWEGRDFQSVHVINTRRAGTINSPYFIPVALRLGNDEDKVWVLAALNPDFLINRFTRYIQTETDRFELMRFDGLSLVTSEDSLSPDEFELASLLPLIQQQEIGTHTGEWLTAYRASPNYPFVVAIRINRDLVLRDWVARTWWQVLATFLALSVMSGITLYLMRQLKRSEWAEQQQRVDLARSRDNAEAATRAKSDFLANMSHEIRTPMNGLIGMTELALEEEMSQSAENYVRNAHTAAVSLLGILNDILDFSKIEAGKLQIESINFNLKELIDDIMTIQACSAQNKGLMLRSNWDKNLPTWVKGDPLRISQIINNLVGNAIKFTHSGCVDLNLSKSMDNTLRIDVKDQGVGMNEQQLAHLFKPFSQADTSITRLYGGTGLGLAICQHLCERMGGEISVTSQPGVGSCFTVDLPFEAAIEVQRESQPSQPHSQTKYDMSNMRVLLVEDHALNRQLLLALLDKVGVSTEVAVHGQDALQKLSAADMAYDLVLMDIQMPVMDGIAATKALRSDARFNDLPIIAVTANALSDERELCLNAGMQAYLVKPIDRQTLYEALVKWGRKHAKVDL